MSEQYSSDEEACICNGEVLVNHKRKETHNVVERRRKDKINVNILRLGDLLPDKDPKKQFCTTFANRRQLTSFTMPAPPAPRKQYSAAFKRKVILAAEAVGNSAAGRRFGVNEGSIRGWRRQKAALFACSGTRRSFRGPKQGSFPDLEEELTAFIKDQRAQHLAVNIELLQQKARELARGKGIPPTDFKASKHWVSRFMTRAGFSLRRRTSISQKLPERYEELLISFQRHILSLRKATTFQLGQIGNADQTPVYLDMPSEFTVHEKGSREVCVRTTGNEKTRVTVMLGCTADGRKLPPYVVFKRKTLPKNEKFPKSVIVRCQDKGWMDETLVLDWVKSVWCRRPGALLSFPSIPAGGTCESRCLESGVSTDPEPCGFACPRLTVRGFPVSGEKGILVVEPSPG
ncbi:Pogo ele1 orf1-h 1e-40-j 4 [Ixodes scapularis]